MFKSKTGFTIIELLIVVVVIGILAAISIVAYNGIQSRARNTVVKNDLSKFAKVLELFKVDHGHHVYSLYQLNEGEGQIKISDKTAYAQAPLTINNLTACFSIGGEEVALAALSADDKFYYIYSGDGFTVSEKPNTQWHHNDTTAQQRCQEISPTLSPISPSTGNPMNFNGYNSQDTTTGPWRNWTRGE